jgi:glucose-6-phosphate isomerase
MLELDYTNVLSDAVGEHGVSRADLSVIERSSQGLIDRLETARTAGRIGFADLPFDDATLASVTAFAREHSFRNILILGIGGSALGPAALDSALSAPTAPHRLIVLDNIDPDFVHDSLQTLEPSETLVNVIAKSGVTAETMATFAIVWQWMRDGVGPEKVREHFVATTDPEKGDLLAIARQEKIPVFSIPPNVGGRFSVLSPVGTLPAALLGLNVEEILSGARQMALQCRRPLDANPALAAAAIQWLLDSRRGKTILVLFPYVQSLWKFAFWFKQLWGESLGKRLDRSQRTVHCGQTPTAALGATDQHSQLQLFIEGPNNKSFLFFAAKSFRQNLPIQHPFAAYDSMKYLQDKSIAELFDAERRATEIALTEAGRPNCTVTVERVDEAALGSLIMFSEYMTAFAGELYDIDAFDQPGVEYGKKLTFSMMGRAGYDNLQAKTDLRWKERALIR